MTDDPTTELDERPHTEVIAERLARIMRDEFGANVVEERYDYIALEYAGATYHISVGLET